MYNGYVGQPVGTEKRSDAEDEVDLLVKAVCNCRPRVEGRDEAYLLSTDKIHIMHVHAGLWEKGIDICTTPGVSERWISLVDRLSPYVTITCKCAFMTGLVNKNKQKDCVSPQLCESNIKGSYYW